MGVISGLVGIMANILVAGEYADRCRWGLFWMHIGLAIVCFVCGLLHANRLI